MSFKHILQRPHLISDLEGRGISCFDLATAWSLPETPLFVSHQTRIGTIRCATNDLPDFLSFFINDDLNLKGLREESLEGYNRILERDIEFLLSMTIDHQCNLNDLLFKCATFLRSHLRSETVSIYGLPDGIKLTCLIELNAEKTSSVSDEKWDQPLMSIVSKVFKEKQPYVCSNPKDDAVFDCKNSDIASIPKNLVCFPILNGGIPVGLISVNNKWQGSFNDRDLWILRKFSIILSHILKEEFESIRGEKFINTSVNLGKYLSRSIVRQIASTGTSGNLGGEMKKTVVLFSDIRNFTAITEGAPASLLVELLNFYFEEMSLIIAKYGGTLDKLVGDLMMVLWNIPVDQPEPELLAMKAAIEMQKSVARIVAPYWRDMGIDHFGIGIGINSGDAIAGNMGSSQFRNYTAIGSTINIAQRLEAKAKAGEIWIHADMYPSIEGKVPPPSRKEYSLQLKGIKNSIEALIFLPMA